jgi:hypothetical protein
MLNALTQAVDGRGVAEKILKAHRLRLPELRVLETSGGVPGARSFCLAAPIG